MNKPQLSWDITRPYPPKIIFPTGMDTSDWVEVSSVTDEFAKFVHRTKPGIIDCHNFYIDYINYIQS